MSEKHPLHLKNPELQTSHEVNEAVFQEERETGEQIPNDPDKRIDAYLKRLERLIFDPDKKQKRKPFGDLKETERPRALALLREAVMNKEVRKNREKMAQGAQRVEEGLARQLGVPVEYNEQALEQRGDIAVGDIESSLDQWIAYLSDRNESYPIWFRYYVFRNVLKLQDYDKSKGEFPERSKGTYRLFPEIDRGALGHVQEIIEASQDKSVLGRIIKGQQENGIPKEQQLTKEKADAFLKLSFANQYKQAMQEAGEVSPEILKETKGEWVKYDQGSDPTKLWASLQNKGVPWCTKGFPTAETQLKGGDFYVYYTYRPGDEDGKPSIPRIAIRMEGKNKIAEDPRGRFDSQQNLEPEMLPVLKEQFGRMEKDVAGFREEAEKFEKKRKDMEALTGIDNAFDKKTKQWKRDLTADELKFLYEMDGSIEGFGYQKDPRVAELRKKRKDEATQIKDMCIIFECGPNQIAHNPSEINNTTKAYVGQIKSGIFKKAARYQNLEYIYAKFSEKIIKIFEQTIGGENRGSKQQLINENKLLGIKFSDYAESMLEKVDFVHKNEEKITLVVLSVADMGLPNGVKINQIYGRAKKLGLKVFPVEANSKLPSGGEVALNLGRDLKESRQQVDSLNIGMNPITIPVGGTGVFNLHCSGDGKLWIGNSWADRITRHHLTDKFVFGKF